MNELDSKLHECRITKEAELKAVNLENESYIETIKQKEKELEELRMIKLFQTPQACCADNNEVHNNIVAELGTVAIGMCPSSE